jgi:hypothetical protein
MNDAEIVHALALRLLAPREFADPSWTPSELLVGQLPPDLADGVPVPPNSRVLGSLVRGRAHVDVELDTDLPAAAVRSFYTEQLTAAGWRVVELQWHRHGGFSYGSAPAQHTLFCRGKRGPAITIAASEETGQPTEVRITVMLDARQSPCAHVEQMDNPWHMLPDLRPPANAHQIPSGGSGGGDSVISMATLTSELDVAAIAAHYQDQLAAAGWTVETAEQQGAVAWSRWRFADKNGDAWRGMFVLLQTRATPNQYSVQLHAQMADVADTTSGPIGISRMWRVG